VLTASLCGPAIEKKHPRMYNCSVRHMDSIRAFAEVFFLLLCGSGVTIGLKQKYINRLPSLVSKSDKNGIVINYVVEDTIEGWADSVEALLMCYFKNTATTGRKIMFDYSRIRPKGAPLKTGGGLAPGHRGLQLAHKRIKATLDHMIETINQTTIKSINVYDIIMHCSDAVLSGGIRRAATMAIFSKDDNDMLNAKGVFKIDHKSKFSYNKKNTHIVGIVEVDGIDYKVEFKKNSIVDNHWYKHLLKKKEIYWSYIYPWRARSNNSVLLMKDELGRDEFKKIFQKVRLSGEPGFIFAFHEDQLFNPCQPGFAPILDNSSNAGPTIKTFDDIDVGSTIWSKEGWSEVTKKWCTGLKNVYEYRTSSGVFYGTSKHEIVSHGEKVQVGKADSIDALTASYQHTNDKGNNTRTKDIMDGLVVGDGSKHSESKNKVLLYIGENDSDYFKSEIKDLIFGQHPAAYAKKGYVIGTTITEDELPKIHKRVIPDRYIYGSITKKLSFLRGLFSANGSICGNRITLKATSFELISQVQMMLSSVGIASYYTTNKASDVKWKNGVYTSKESYDLNISTDRLKFFRSIGFIQEYKTNKLEKVIRSIKTIKGKTTFDIISTKFLGKMKVYDITVDNNSHTYWTGGVDVSNCGEVGFIPQTEDGVCGVQFCNLTSINGAQCDTFEKFLEAAEAATIIGTLQAAYTDFPYLSAAAKQLTEEEALLGVSVTGWFDNPSVLLNARNQFLAAELVKKINEEWANIIGINVAARTTLTKPEGTNSIVVKAASGAHGHHAKPRYFRRMQMNKVDPVYKHFKKFNSHMTEESIWSANNTDDIITWPITVPDDVISKDDMSAIEHLNTVKQIQENWVVTGTNNNVNKKNITHNVSVTIDVRDEEWDEVEEYLYTNRHSFAAVSLLSKHGDREYEQSPLQKVIEEDRALWNKLVSDYTKIDWTEFKEKEDNTKVTDAAACAGGACETDYETKI